MLPGVGHRGEDSPSLLISWIFWGFQFPREDAGLHFLARYLL